MTLLFSKRIFTSKAPVSGKVIILKGALSFLSSFSRSFSSIRFQTKLIGRFLDLSTVLYLLNEIVIARSSLAAFIILPLIIIGAMIMFPSLIVNSGNIISKMYYVIGQSMHIITAKWQLFTYYCLVFLACLYTFYQMTAAEK